MNKVKQLVQDLAEQLAPVYEHPATATNNAWWILEAITGLAKEQLLSKQTVALTAAQQEKLTNWVDALVHKHTPLQYLIGTVPFLDLSLTITPPILIPRPETEEWVANLIAMLRAENNLPQTILDLCTGSGCIALALAQAFEKSTVYAVDINQQALTLAQENARRNNIQNVLWSKSDLFEQVPPIKFDLMSSNPPYIDEKEWEQLAPEVKLWEDRQALIASDCGYGLIKIIIAHAPDFLAPSAQLYIEIGHEQGPKVKELFEKRGFEQVEIIQDLQRKDRVVKGIWKQS
jgi:release factor glutamine methyltransferase